MINFKRLGIVALVGGLGFGTAACTDYGYGYGGASLGYGLAYVGDPYYGGYGGGWDGWGGGYYGGGAWGWNNNFYYPGTGVYVYDRYRRPHRWNDAQRRYWQSRPGWNQPGARANWNDFRRDVRGERRDYRGDIRDNRRDFQNGTINREQYQQGRRDARRDYRQDVRQDYRDYRRDNRADGIRTPRANPGRFQPPRTRGGEARPNIRPR